MKYPHYIVIYDKDRAPKLGVSVGYGYTVITSVIGGSGDPLNDEKLATRIAELLNDHGDRLDRLTSKVPPAGEDQK